MNNALRNTVMKRILVFGAHPDDAEVGMGGTIAKYARQGHTVRIVTCTLPDKSEARLQEADAAAAILGAQHQCLRINPEEMRFDRKMTTALDEIISEFDPQIIFTHWIHDSHNDHQVVSNATIAATRKNTCSVYMYEQTIPGGITPFSFRAQKYIDISDFIEEKTRSLEAHISQKSKYGEWWLYGVKGRAQYRGFQIQKKYAEAFEVIKDIEC